MLRGRLPHTSVRQGRYRLISEETQEEIKQNKGREIRIRHHDGTSKKSTIENLIQ
jgi:hypothetical protein